MRCDYVRPLISAAADGELTSEERAVVDDELARCSECRSFAHEVERLRQRLRFEAVDDAVDLAPRVRLRLREAAGSPVTDLRPAHRDPRSRRWLVAAVAAAVVGFVSGAVFVGVAREPESPVAALDVTGAVLESQRAVTQLSAHVSIVERGWHPEVPVRMYQGDIRYASPESLALQLDDRTVYPDAMWPDSDVTVVSDGPVGWTRAHRSCPRASVPECLAEEPVVRSTVAREPFPDASPLPLDVIVPVKSFLRGNDVDVETATVNGRDAVGMTVEVAQVRPLLDGFFGDGTWRDVYPADRVDLWLDAATMVPLRIVVRAADDSGRSEWASRRGYSDVAGDAVLEVELTEVDLTTSPDNSWFPPPPVTASERVAGFSPDRTVAQSLRPSSLPDGMRLVRSGHVARTGIRSASWSDGRAWLKIRATDAWDQERLFGDLTGVAREVDVGAAGVIYTDERGERVSIHGAASDFVVTGSLSEEELVEVAASMGVKGMRVPSSWDEASSMSVEALAATRPDLLVPRDLEGFSSSAARLEGDGTRISYAGAGDRGFTVVQEPSARLGPPLDVDAREIEVRGTRARWNPTLGTLEWVEDGATVSIVSDTLGIEQLVSIANSLSRR